MKLKNYQEWHKKPEFENLMFLGQRLDELFFDYTLDTYKPPALNSVFLCREAIELIKDIEAEVIDEANLGHVLDELEWALRSDPVAKYMLNAPVEKFVLRAAGVKLSEARIRLEVLERTLNPIQYLALCESMLMQEMANGSKKIIESVVRVYASALVNMGVSKQHLYEKTQGFFFYRESLVCAEEVVEYFKSISVVEHHYEIYFLVSDLVKEVSGSIGAFDLAVIDVLPADILAVSVGCGLTPLEKEVWVEVKGVRAFDRHSARHKAEATLDMVRDMFLLFSHKNRIDWRGESIITQCCDEQPILIRKPKNPMEKCFDLRVSDASDKLNNMISNMSLSGASFTKFHRAVDLHAIGASGDVPENQLLNIWIALETLIPSSVHGGGKIVKVSNGLMPMLLKNYLSRLVKRLAGDLVRWSRTKTNKILRAIPGAKSKSLYQKVLELVSISSNKELLGCLYAELGEFYLLRFRVYEISSLFKSPKNAVDRIELHQRKVTWQLRRIYRTRNLIVHSGRPISYIDALIENSHDYLDQAMSSVLEYTCGFLEAKSLDQAFDMAKIDYDVYLAMLGSIKVFDESNVKFILCGVE